MTYFAEHDAINRKFGDRVEETICTIADRYIGANPKHPPIYRVFCKDGFVRNGDYRYEINLEQKYSELRDGQFVYVWAKLWSDIRTESQFSVSCYSPLRLYVNGREAFRSNIMDESFPDRKNGVKVQLEPGWNHFVLRFMKTATGCGGRFGASSMKRPVHFLVPSPEREGQEGWIYSEPVEHELQVLPGDGTAEAETGIRWLPKLEWDEQERSCGQLARMYGLQPGRVAYAWTKVIARSAAVSEYRLHGVSKGHIVIQVNGSEIFAAREPGTFSIPIQLPFGEHELVVKALCSGSDWGFELGAETNSGFPALSFKQPHPVEGAADPWLYLGPLDPSCAVQAADICRMDTVIENEEGGTYWGVDLPGCAVRAYLENPLYGGWNYPLGVTLYGLLQSGAEVKRDDYVQYVLDHIELATAHDRYALWDRKQYGAAGINPLLSAIDSLDDCGSFGATTLVAMKYRELRGGRAAADRIVDYITHVQDRLPDGALYRVHGSVEFMKDTMWCDDLYMSTPFLCRYYELTGDQSYIDDAARQFLLYKKYMYMPDQNIMSHIYDFKFDKPNRIPWGRGNGWVLFSLTELLAHLPEQHPSRGEIMKFYRDLCEGYLRLQGQNGLWHQVLNIPESYEETSCTSMFMYAFARGVRFGWLEEPAAYIEAVHKGWEGLTRISIDKNGNVYGVCRGSGYSFSPLYYKDELSWNLNDTHGIGIVLLAGIETIKMRNYLERGEKLHENLSRR